MICGLGVDIVDVARFERALTRTPRLAERLFTAAERDGRSPESLAARFAAKEALAKCLGAPGGLRWLDAVVTSAPDGRPGIAVSGTVAQAAARRGVGSWRVSLSHDAGLAVAVVIAEGTPG